MKRFACLLLPVCFGSLLHAQSGKVLDNLSMKKVLNMDRKHAVY